MQRNPLAAAASHLLACLSICIWISAARPALAGDAGIEKQAQVLQKKAIEEDNLNLNYPEAIKKLATAISKCGPDKCNATLKGSLYRDLGAMLILNGSADDGRSAFSKALALDPALDLDPAYKSAALDSVWSDVKRKTSGAAATATPSGGGTELPPEPGGAPSTGDFAHAPAAAQLVRTPVPIYAEYMGAEKIVRVVVKYRGAGMSDWKSLELRKLGTGYGGLIPCGDVAEGKLQYYIQGYGASEDPVAAAGSRTRPFTVAITGELSGPAPTLPGQEPPKQCAAGAVSGGDCPPDFPGCHSAKKLGGEDCNTSFECESGSCASGKCADKKGEGDECDKDEECLSDACSDGKCAGGRKSVGDQCESDDQCASGNCNDGRCSEGHSKKRMHRFWIGVAGSLDFSLLPASENVCVLNMAGTSPLNSAGYQCVDPASNANFPGRDPMTNTNIAQGRGSQVGDQVAGGFTNANLRLLVSFDYALSMNVLLGARAGYVLFADPANAPGSAFAPVHFEARGTFLVGKDALTSSVAPLLLVAAGVGEFDASIGVTVQFNSGGNKQENAWVTAGPLFLAAGGGLRLMLGTDVAATAVIKAQPAFGGSAGLIFGFAPELGVQVGF